MKCYDVIVVGGSAAGITAAITARRTHPDKTTLLVRKEEKVLIPCGIPYVYGTVGTPEKNLIPDGILSNNQIELMVADVLTLDPEKKHLSLKGSETISYDKLILATGSEPLKLPIPGLDKENVFFVKKDTRYLQGLLDKSNNVKEVVVLGGGFIGVEFADEFRKKGLQVTIVEMLPHCLMLAFEESLCTEAEKKLVSRGVTIATNTRIEEIVGNGSVRAVKFSDGRELKADLVLVGVGVQPNTGLAREAGLAVDRGGIVVDSAMRTSNADIFACGDCAGKRSFFTGKPSGLRLASVAAIEARIAGANLFAVRRHNPGVIGVFATAIGDLVLATAGLSEKAARDEGYEVACGQAEAPDRHPGGMPGMSQMKVKLVFDKNSRQILGGQAMGGPSVGELINTISACIQNRMTADDIVVFQLGTHPAVTASPIAYQMVNAAETAFMKIQ